MDFVPKQGHFSDKKPTWDSSPRSEMGAAMEGRCPHREPPRIPVHPKRNPNNTSIK